MGGRQSPNSVGAPYANLCLLGAHKRWTLRYQKAMRHMEVSMLQVCI